MEGSAELDEDKLVVEDVAGEGVVLVGFADVVELEALLLVGDGLEVGLEVVLVAGGDVGEGVLEPYVSPC